MLIQMREFSIFNVSAKRVKKLHSRQGQVFRRYLTKARLQKDRMIPFKGQIVRNLFKFVRHALSWREISIAPARTPVSVHAQSA